MIGGNLFSEQAVVTAAGATVYTAKQDAPTLVNAFAANTSASAATITLEVVRDSVTISLWEATVSAASTESLPGRYGPVFVFDEDDILKASSDTDVVIHLTLTFSALGQPGA